MTISKKTQTLLGVVAVGALAYYIWDNNRKKDQIFANASGRRIFKRTPPSPIFAGSEPTYVESRLANDDCTRAGKCKVYTGMGTYTCKDKVLGAGGNALVCPDPYYLYQ
jgi:hypothetical protein